MGAVGGSIESVTLKGRTFSVGADADVNRKIGGFENDVQSNGDGSARLIKTRVPFKEDGLNISVDDARGDQKFIQDLANLNDFFGTSVTYASGAIWQGNAQIVGEFQYSSQNATASVNLSGTGTLTKQ